MKLIIIKILKKFDLKRLDKKKYYKKMDDLKKNIILISGNSNKNLSKKISNYLEIGLTPIILNQFNNTEINVKILENIRNKDIFLIQTGSTNNKIGYSINDILIETIILINACRLSSCKSITLICPLLFYSRSDKKDLPRTPISARAIADILNIDRLITLDLHSNQAAGFYKIPVDNLYSVALVANYLNKTLFKDLKDKSDFLAISPDVGAVARTLAFSKRLNLDMIICHKQRNYEKKSTIDKLTIIKNCDINNKTGIIFDDMADSCGTLIKCIDALVAEGIKEVYCIITHGILSCDATDKINNCKHLKKIIICNTIDQTENIKKSNKIEIIDTSKLFGECIKCLFNGNSISNLDCFK